MNDNDKNDDWLGAGFRTLGILLFIGALLLGIFCPMNVLIATLALLMGICGFAMVMV